MGALLAPWPFLESGATAVEVATIFDGATVEQRYLWSDGDAVARDPGGGLLVRPDESGFEVVLPRGCDGEVAVGRRTVDVRELTLCGVAAVPIGSRTRATLRVGAVTFVVAGTTAPRRLALGPTGSWRRRAGLAATALVACACGTMLHWTAQPKRAEWTIPDIVRTRVALLVPALEGGRAATVARSAVEPPSPRARTQPQQRTQTATAKKMQQVQAKQQRPQAQAKQLRPRAQAKQLRPQAEAQPASLPKLARLTEESADRAAAPRSLEQLDTQTIDDARTAAAMQAQAAGIVGALAHARAAFLGDHAVAAATFTDTGTIGISSADAANGAANGSGLGDEMGNLEGDQIGEAYGVGGLGLAGIGEGGGGVGDGTIGLGDIGTIGHGGGHGGGYGGGYGDDTGSGVGYGYGSGRCAGLARHVAAVPDVLPGRAQVRGSCDRDLIRRVVRAHINEVRFCYERTLQTHPSLTGRVQSTFVVAPTGHVTASSATGVDPGVAQCIAAAVQRWTFPRCAGEVHYPFMLAPATPAVP
jgi:hypothetical protein